MDNNLITAIEMLESMLDNNRPEINEEQFSYLMKIYQLLIDEDVE